MKKYLEINEIIANIWGPNSIPDQFRLSFLYLHLVVVVEGLLHLAVIAAESIKLVAGHGCWLLGNVRNYCLV